MMNVHHLHVNGLDVQHSLTHDEISHEPPVDPLSFPIPQIHAAQYSSINLFDPSTRSVRKVNAIARLVTSNSDVNLPTHDERAYFIKKKLAKCKYGSVRLCVVLRRLDHARLYIDLGDNEAESASLSFWECTNETVVIKIISRSKLRRAGKTFDLTKEVASLQHAGNGNPYVVGCIEALQDDERLYSVMPYCTGGDLYNLSRVSSFSEAQARIWFRQLMQGLLHLQKKGICHRGIALENLFLNDKNNLVIGGFSIALRVPYTDNTNIGAVSDASEGMQRRLINEQDLCGSLTYLAPELIDRHPSFDGFAVDLWSAGCVLFILLVGMAPFRMAHSSDASFARISRGELRELIWSAGIEVSDNACNLLQNMLYPNPRQRFTLAQVMNHPWVLERSDSSGRKISIDDNEAMPASNKIRRVSSSSQSQGLNDQVLCSSSPQTQQTLSYQELPPSGSSPRRHKHITNRRKVVREHNVSNSQIGRLESNDAELHTSNVVANHFRIRRIVSSQSQAASEQAFQSSSFCEQSLPQQHWPPSRLSPYRLKHDSSEDSQSSSLTNNSPIAYRIILPTVQRKESAKCSPSHKRHGSNSSFSILRRRGYKDGRTTRSTTSGT